MGAPAMIGQTLSHFHITAKLGEGGMGDKVLPEAFTRDPERLARFEREAHVLASLNHPNIAAIHDLVEADGTHFLELELAQCETLASRLSRGPIPVRETVPLALQIAEALEAAHEKGIVHRDLKPGNLMVDKDGKVKVLDFGLAKAWGPETADADFTHSPTLTAGMTRSGAILGTAAYMSPEQARGEDVDKRADIWAFGCVLYEMLTGRGAFGGGSVAEALAAVLEHEPDWDKLPRSLPLKGKDVLKRCLHKDPRHRLHDIADARIELVESQSEPPEGAVDATGTRPRRAWLAGALAGLALIALSSYLTIRMLPEYPGASQNVTRFSLAGTEDAPGEHLGTTIAISPDGRSIFYGINLPSGVDWILVRHDLATGRATPIPGTESAVLPFVSPDSGWLGFVSWGTGSLKRMPVAGGPSTELAHVMQPGASWGSNGNILVVTDNELRAVPSDGGPEKTLVRSPVRDRRTIDWPDALPGQRAALLVANPWEATTASESSVVVADFATRELEVLLHNGTNPRYSSSGHLLFARDGNLLAVPFDADRLEVSGRPKVVVEGVGMSQAAGNADFAISDNGTLVYRDGGVEPGRTLVWVDRDGEMEEIPLEAQGFFDVGLSPDGSYLAVTSGWTNHQLWVYDFEREVLTRLTFEGDVHSPIWTPDGTSLVFGFQKWEGQASVEESFDIVQVRIDQSTEVRRLTPSMPGRQDPEAMTPDGGAVLFSQVGGETGIDCWLLQLEGGEPTPILDSRGDELRARISPDGNWVAYDSDESGTREVYVQAFPSGGAKWQVSADGGQEPLWSHDGRELFYRGDEMLMAVGVELGSSFRPGKPVALFRDEFQRQGYGYAVSVDGSRFLMIKAGEKRGTGRLTVVLNWFEELKRIF
jgi:serine/threonine-protein kinase